MAIGNSWVGGLVKYIILGLLLYFAVYIIYTKAKEMFGKKNANDNNK